MSGTAISTLDLPRQVVRGKRLARHVWTHFQEDRCFEEAASLSYTSLLSMVPLLAVVFGIVSVFPVFNEWSNALQSFIFDNFLPDTGEQIVPHINTFLESVSSLTLPGTLMLLVTALLLMVRIEVAFNRIWRVDRNRSLTNRIVMYWALLTLGPLLIAAAIALSATRIFGASGIVGDVPPAVQTLGTFLLSWLVFTLFFVLVPNRQVRFRHALIGALLSTVLFSLAKAGFVAYVSNANYTVIYGALATVPIFLFWLYLVWIVVLLGASLSASLTTFSDYSRYDSDWPERWEFQLVVRLVGHLGEAQLQGRSLSREQLMELEPQASELQIVRLMGRLGDENVATRDEDGNWLLARDLRSLSLGGLYLMGDYYLPVAEIAKLPQESRWDQAYVAALELIRNQSQGVWDQPLKDLYAGEAGSGGPS
ncbi:YihY family inner membrane protein [Pseudomonadota bacterium]|nr:YihY family inner membrane protein [Xanthomonadales bacterium]